MFFTIDILVDFSNIQIKPNSIVYNKYIEYNNPISYMSILDNYIFYKEVKSNNKYDEVIKRMFINDPLNPIIDNSFILNEAIANHNMYFFKDKYSNIKMLGGQHCGISTKELFDNDLYSNYHKKNIFIDSKKFYITMGGYHKIYNPLLACPYYANGLHLFEFDKNKFNKLNCLNNYLPILSGIHPGRYDGHYGYTDNKNIKNSRNGLTVYDSIGSVVFNSDKNLYFLYHRSNIGTGRRTIQYTTSSDLISWSEYNLVNFDNNYNHFDSNIYYSNFFKIHNIYIAILPYVKRINNDYNSIDNKLYYNLYYSYDCINYFLIGPILVNNIQKLEHFEMAVNKPLIKNNMMYFYERDNISKKLNIYLLKKYRFFYITNLNNKEASFKIKIEDCLNKCIFLNFTVEESGFFLIELSDINNNIIPGYSYEDFDKTYNNDEINFIPKWLNKILLPKNELFINFKIFNASFYNLECKS